jgi:hypothetical protein
MSDYSTDIIFYERSRQDVRDLEKQYTELHRNCEGLSEALKEHAGDYALLYGNCINASYDSIAPMKDENGEDYSLNEIISNYGCDNCQAAWALKRGDLAAAKQKFGEAKRNIARVGKKLIKALGQDNDRG